jgi:hypothetical protein
MPLSGEYEPSRNDRDRRQVELYEATNGREGGTLKGKPVIILTFKGSKFGKIRKTPLMRIEHNGTYAVVASNAGATAHPFLVAQHRRQSAGRVAVWGDRATRCGSAKSSARKRKNGGSALTPHRISPPTEPAQTATSGARSRGPVKRSPVAPWPDPVENAVAPGDSNLIRFY